MATPQPGASTAPDTAPRSPEDESTEDARARGARDERGARRADRTSCGGSSPTGTARGRPALRPVFNREPPALVRGKLPQRLPPPQRSVNPRAVGEANAVGLRRIDASVRGGVNRPFRNPFLGGR